jgi:hypothetical protein
MIKKPTIIVTSLGRTGTQFFSALFTDILPDSASLHEPDVFNFLQYEGTNERLRQTVKQIRQVGFHHLFVRKALGRGSVIKLSDLRVCGRLEYSEAARRLLKQRSTFVGSREGSVYIEANAGYYGVLDVLDDVFVHHKAAYIVRDGREWVRSNMNWGQMYNKGKIRRFLAHTWPAASEMEEDPFRSEWNSMSRFERICWAWIRLNEYALRTIEENPDARVFRFEEIFKANGRHQHLTELVSFATDMPGVGPVPPRALDGWLDRKIHGSSGDFPAWPEWSSEHRGQFSEICRPLMEALDYELD